jgi:predicted CXXCH cytochrome family protein
LKFRTILVMAMIALAAGLAAGQAGDVLGSHDMSPASGSPITGNLGSPCMYCHAPHSGLNGTAGVLPTPLWDQKLSNVTSYQNYTSTTMVNPTNPVVPLGSNSSLCLSCHDGTVAMGTLTPYGKVSMTSSLAGTPADLGTNLQTTHPFNFITPLKAAADLWSSLSAVPPYTQDPTGAVKLINGNVECGSCHNPHVQYIDPNGNFLVINNSNPNSPSALCVSCHSTVPSGTGMGLTQARMRVGPATAAGNATSSTSSPQKGQRNLLELWRDSIHAIAPNRIATQAAPPGFARHIGKTPLVSYSTVRTSGCLSCHTTHNAAPNSLLRGAQDQTCINCHSGGTNVSPPASNIYAEMAAPKISHSLPTTNGNNSHFATESDLLSRNRHATCVDCHNPHAAKQVGLNFSAPPAARPSQNGVVGISASDGQSTVYPAVNQYENCLRCHGTSTGKTANPMVFGYLPNWLVSSPDPLNVIPQFSATSTSSHPVMHDRSSPFPQPSLRPNMLNLDGSTKGRTMGMRILCTDCHNSDDNREFGGTGPNGPHGSKYSHILERRYDMSQAPAPGRSISNLNLPPNLSTVGNYALCAKCHDLGNVVSNTSFSEHARHINDGFSCSVCHTAHGMGGQTATVSGERMVDFDLNVVAPSGAAPIAYRRSTNSCSLTCHGHAHSLAGGAAGAKMGRIRTR